MSVKFNFGTLGQPFEVDWPVRVQVPIDGGGVEEQVFTARMRLLGKEELDLASSESNAVFMRRFFVGFGRETEETLTDELWALMCARPWVVTALYRAWNEVQSGAAAKN